MKKRLRIKAITCVLLTLLILAWGNSLSIYLKATLAQGLISLAWEKTLKDSNNHPPWPWADTWPVGKLYFPKQGKTLFILAGSHGSSLAFGPGLVDGTPQPNERGTKVIGGHRDTHFAFLENIQQGEMFLMQGMDQRWHYYRIRETTVVNSEHSDWLVDTNKSEVHLITCFPFDDMLESPMRYVVIAEQIFLSSHEQTATFTVLR